MANRANNDVSAPKTTCSIIRKMAVERLKGCDDIVTLSGKLDV